MKQLPHTLKTLLIILLVTGIGAGITLLAYERYQERSWQILSRDFNRSANSYSDFIENTFSLRIEELGSIGRYFAASQKVDRNQFKTFVSELLEREGGYLALIWAPVVEAKQRSTFEFSASNELNQPYKIRDYQQHSQQSQHKPAHDKMAHDKTPIHHAKHPPPESYTPVLFVEPLETNRKALGFNISSEKNRRSSFERAARENRVIASERLTLIHQNNDPTGFILAFPVRRKEAESSTDHLGFDNIEGFLVGRMSARKVMHYALNNKNLPDLVIRLIETVNDKKQVIVSYGDQDRIYSKTTTTPLLNFNRPVEFGGHHWEIEILPTQEYIKEHLARGGPLLLVSGLTLTLLLTLYILTLHNQRRKAEIIVAKRTAQLKDSELKLNKAQQIARLGSWQLDHNSGEMIWSDTLYDIFEVSPDTFTVTLNSYRTLLQDDKDKLATHAFNAHLNDRNEYHLIHEFKCNDGKTKYLEEYCETQYDADNHPVSSIGTVQDITEQKETEFQIEHMAHHDALTGLPNRMLFKERFTQARAHAHRNQNQLALIFVDLDGFKIINDSLGHSIGDALLKEVSNRLQSSTRGSDIIGRQGGDEFLICLTDIADSLTVTHACEEILNRLRESIVLNEHTLGISASLGIAIYPDNDESFENLLRKADTAMYSAKNAGRNTYRFFSDEMNADMLHRLKLLNDMRIAIENRKFFLHYQPLIDMATGKIVGAEALMRWQDNHGNLVSPATFIPIAEESGLILKLGQFALEESCGALSHWQDEGYDLTMAVNISAIQLSQLDFLKDIATITKAAGIKTSSLDLELTESMLLTDTVKTILMVKSVKQLGVKLSIDDFGTGYSSLSYLKQLNADTLKIDRSFIKDIPYDQDSISIIRAIIHMSHDLGLKIVAEGIENSKQFDLLKELGCDISQGYYFSRPVDAETFQKLLKENGIRKKKSTNLITFNHSK